MACTRGVSWWLVIFSCLTAASAWGAAQREVTGILLDRKTRSPIAGQKLVLDRAPGDYMHFPLAILLFGTPQPGTIATAVTDSRGCFRFVTQKDRGRYLTVRASGVASSDFRSRRGYAVGRLHDSLSPQNPHVDFDASTMHDPRGGFIPVP